MKYAQLHGRSLVMALEAAFSRSIPTLRVISDGLCSVLDTGDLEFLSADRADFAYPVQIIRFGNDLMFLAMGSEVIVDYEMRFLRAQTSEVSARGL